MSQSNLQVRIPDEVHAQIDRLAPRSKSAFVREAIEEKIRREKFRLMEEQWIRALKKHPDTRPDDKRWFKAQKWSDE